METLGRNEFTLEQFGTGMQLIDRGKLVAQLTERPPHFESTVRTRAQSRLYFSDDS